MRQSFPFRGFSALAGLFAIGGIAFLVTPVSGGQTQGAMNAAGTSEFKKSDATMNAAYQKLMAAVGKPNQPKLKAAQQAWLKFRDAEAAFLSSKASGGSVYPTVLAGNKTTLTKARTEALNKAYTLFTTEGQM